MITTDHVRAFAAYNRWQNHSIYGAADRLADSERKADRGAFFGSIHGTLNHILWGDMVWAHRLAGMPRPRPQSIATSVDFFDSWEDLKRERFRIDRELVAWADALAAQDLDGDLTWYSGGAGREITKPRWLLFCHLFNHQTHHRGQVHCLLTQAGVTPDDTDLPFGPDS